MLESLLHHKKEEKEYLCALVVAEDRIDAALWEATSEGKVTVLKTAQNRYDGEWDKAIDAADKTISEIETGLPEGMELKKTVFGLFPEWLVEDRIKDAYLKKLKQLTTALSITPLGFVELPTAVARLLQKDEGIQQTVILVGVESKHVTVSIFKIGKLVGSVTETRSDTLTGDVEKILATFIDVEVLPSRVLLYGTAENLDELKSKLLDYPWQKKANFLHFPKIEVLGNDFPAKAVAISSATEITPHVDGEEGGNAEETPVTKPAQEQVPFGTSAEVKEIAEDLGFVKDEDIGKPDTKGTKAVESEAHLSMSEPEEVENVEPVAVPARKKIRFPTTPHFRLPKMSIQLKIPRFAKGSLIGALFLMLLVVSGGVVAGYWVLPKARVQLLVTPQTLDESEEITVDVRAQKVDTEHKILPAKEITVEVTGNKSSKTSGKKVVGDKAKGEVTVYNKTLNTKTFKKGTIVTASKLKFTLDDDVQVASASEGVASLSYGTAKANLTAQDIGTTANVDSNTDFVFTDLPVTSYSARNEKAFSGGTSKDVDVVTRDDQLSLRKELSTELQQKAEDDITQKLTGSDKLFEKSLKSATVSESFDKEIGEEAGELSLEMKLSTSGTIYNETDLYELLDKVISADVPQSYEYRKENATVTVDSIVENEDTRVFKFHILVKLLPKVETGDLTRELAGKSISDATEFIRSKNFVAGVDFNVDAPLTEMKKFLPRNPANITISVSSL